MIPDFDTLDRDPNEAYEVVPMRETKRGPKGWWTVTCNGCPVRHHPDRAVVERYATDPAHRARLVQVKLWDVKPIED